MALAKETGRRWVTRRTKDGGARMTLRTTGGLPPDALATTRLRRMETGAAIRARDENPPFAEGETHPPPLRKTSFACSLGLAVRVGPGLDPALAGLALAQGSGGLAVRA